MYRSLAFIWMGNDCGIENSTTFCLQIKKESHEVSCEVLTLTLCPLFSLSHFRPLHVHEAQ